MPEDRRQDTGPANSPILAVFAQPENRRYSVFAWALVVLSTIGSGYFLGLFSRPFRDAFGLGHGGIGLFFAITTLISAPLMMLIGAVIDRIDLVRYVLLVAAGLALGCIITGAAPNLLLLGLGIVLVRLMGDWLLPHIAITSLVRHFDTHRGRVSSMLSVGYILGPALLPAAGLALSETLGWRRTWFVMALVIAMLTPLLLRLISNGPTDLAFRTPRPRAPAALHAHPRKEGVGKLLRDHHFLLALVVAACFPITAAALFFHQGAVAEAQGWSLAWMAQAFAAFAVAQVVAIVGGGTLTDRLSARRILPYYPAALLVGLSALLASDHPAAALVYLGGIGFASGMFILPMSILWVELYGSARVGAVRSLAQAVVLLASALSTVGMGWALDARVPFDAILSLLIGYAAIATVVAVVMLRSGDANYSSE